MTYTVVELTRDGSFFNTRAEHMTKEEATELAKQYNKDSRNGSQYFIERED